MPEPELERIAEEVIKTFEEYGKLKTAPQTICVEITEEPKETEELYLLKFLSNSANWCSSRSIWKSRVFDINAWYPHYNEITLACIDLAMNGYRVKRTKTLKRFLPIVIKSWKRYAEYFDKVVPSLLEITVISEALVDILEEIKNKVKMDIDPLIRYYRDLPKTDEMRLQTKYSVLGLQGYSTVYDIVRQKVREQDQD